MRKLTSRLSKLWVVPLVLLLPLSACGSEGSENEQATTHTVDQLQGETMEINSRVRLHIPDGWEAQTADMPGLEVYVATIVPSGTAPDALVPGQERPSFAYLTLMNIGGTHGAETYAAAQMETDSTNTDFYSDIRELEPVEIGGETFYGYEGTLTSNDLVGPIQYWYGDAHGDTYKFEIHGGTDGDIPQDLIDAMNAVEFL